MNRWWIISKIKKVRWDSIITNLVNHKLETENCENINDSDMGAKNNIYEITGTQKRRSPEEFQTYIRSLFNDDNKKVKYKNPSLNLWYLRTRKKSKHNFHG